MNKSNWFRFLLSVVVALAFSTAAFGQATRTWVSGVGDDANPCSRTAPCKTFAGAISKTAEGGEIDALDPGGFGTVTITKALTIDGTHGAGFGSILNAGTNGVNVNIATGAPATLHPNDAVVILRALSIQGSQGNSPGLRGINISRGDRVYVYECHIQNQSISGVTQNLASTGTVFVRDTDFSNTVTAIASSTSSGTAIVQANNISVQGCTNGINLTANGFAFVADSFFARCIGGSALQAANACTIDVTDTNLFSNSTAINALAGSTVRVNDCQIFDNTNGFAGTAASIQSGGNNKLAGNTASITPTGPALINQ